MKHTDQNGMLWRLEDGRPISQIADEMNEEFGFTSKDKAALKKVRPLSDFRGPFKQQQQQPNE